MSQKRSTSGSRNNTKLVSKIISMITFMLPVFIQRSEISPKTSASPL